jgi:hypothetical protein
MKSSTLLAFFVSLSLFAADSVRRPATERELRYWLENMISGHDFSVDEVKAATGLSAPEIEAAVERFGIMREKKTRSAEAPLLVLPYPGGRHPRIGFLEGAVDPRRETKLSIFTPWDPASYVVADVPEAIWSNLGLTYLAHTHVPTIWTKQNIVLPPREWERLANGDFQMDRTLPNGIQFGTLAHPARDAVLMKMWLSNGTARVLTDLRVQNCVMLKGARGFTAQTNENKLLRAPFAACRSESGNRWVISAWKPIHRAWANPPVPCLHADPRFPDTAPGEVSTLLGLVTFYVGSDIEAEFDRLERSWDKLMEPVKKR